jgi:hypothetical protein
MNTETQALHIQSAAGNMDPEAIKSIPDIFSLSLSCTSQQFRNDGEIAKPHPSFFTASRPDPSRCSSLVLIIYGLGSSEFLIIPRLRRLDYGQARAGEFCHYRQKACVNVNIVLALAFALLEGLSARLQATIH